MNTDIATSTNGSGRLLVQKRTETLAVKFDEIVVIYKADDCVFLVTTQKQKWMLDKKLSHIMSELDPSHFFRANRQFIINIDHLLSFRPYQRVKLLLKMSQADLNEKIIISQEQSSNFKRWVVGA